MIKKIMRKKEIKFYLKLSAGLVLLGAVIYWVDFGKVLNLLKRIGFEYFVILLFISIFDRILMAYKWGLLLWADDIEIKLLHLVRAYFYSAFVGMFLPSSIGGDVVRFCAVNSRYNIPKGRLAASIVIEKILGFFSMLFLGFFAALWMLFFVRNNKIGVPLLVLSSLLVIVIPLIVWFFISVLRSHKLKAKITKRFPSLKEKVERMIESIITYSGRKRILAKFYFLSVLEQLFSVAFLYIMAKAFYIHVDIFQISCAVIISLMLARLPISIGGLGVQEGSFAAVFSLMGLSAEEGLAISIGARVFGLMFPLPVVLSYLSESIGVIKRARQLRM